MRALKAATILMGVLILAGTAVLIATIIKRATAPVATVAAAPFALKLDEPAGTRITGITASGDLLALTLSGGGADRVVLLDSQTGRLAGRVTLTGP